MQKLLTFFQQKISMYLLAFAKQKLLTFFSAKNISVFAIFQDRNLKVMLAYNFVQF